LGPKGLLALHTGKIARLASRVTGRGGSTLPGRLALKIEPGLMRHLAGQARRLVMVTGTNGKTTTATLLASILRQTGEGVVHNGSGANLIPGVTSALIGAASPVGRLKAGWAVLEVDEATVPLFLRQVRPDVSIVTNFFRDQLDRYGEIEHIVDLVKQGLSMLPDTSWVVLNADDPMVSGLAPGLEAGVLYYGLDCPEMASEVGSHAVDVRHCRVCDTPYSYQGYYYAHLGIYHCPSCGRERPALSVKASRVEPVGTRGTGVVLGFPDGSSERVFVRVPGLYNVYNVLAAATAAWRLGVSTAHIKAGIEAFLAAFGRMEEVRIKGRRVFLALAKNPAGFNEVLRTIGADQGDKTLLIAINDNTADGKDVSWLWDVDFEVLAEEGALRAVVASGIRAEDMALRLKYGGVDPSRIRWDTDIMAALESALRKTPPGEVLYVLPTYTAMLDLRGRLARRGLVKPW
jgi:UDP-N-acetylmuramyl tripeptide synthase